VTYDRLLDRAVENLTSEELKSITAYTIQKNVKKDIVPTINILNEWELPWNDFYYQQNQYYEYGTMVHLLNNEHLTKDLTHIGLLHYDVRFNKNSISKIHQTLDSNPETIFFQRARGVEDLYLTKYELDQICIWLSHKLDMNFNSNLIWNHGWISEALSLTPKNVFLKFSKFLQENKSEIEDILISNRWGIMNVINHRVCGIVERMWGFYLVSLIHNGNKYEKLDIEHDWDFYTHKHQTEENWIKNNKN
jgi:hypothetical protein